METHLRCPFEVLYRLKVCPQIGAVPPCPNTFLQDISPSAFVVLLQKLESTLSTCCINWVYRLRPCTIRWKSRNAKFIVGWCWLSSCTESVEQKTKQFAHIIRLNIMICPSLDVRRGQSPPIAAAPLFANPPWSTIPANSNKIAGVGNFPSVKVRSYRHLYSSSDYVHLCSKFVWMIGSCLDLEDFGGQHPHCSPSDLPADAAIVVGVQKAKDLLNQRRCLMT